MRYAARRPKPAVRNLGRCPTLAEARSLSRFLETRKPPLPSPTVGTRQPPIDGFFPIF